MAVARGRAHGDEFFNECSDGNDDDDNSDKSISNDHLHVPVLPIEIIKSGAKAVSYDAEPECLRCKSLPLSDSMTVGKDPGVCGFERKPTRPILPQNAASRPPVQLSVCRLFVEANQRRRPRSFSGIEFSGNGARSVVVLPG